MKFHEWGLGVDPDESCWVESVKFNLSFLVVIRVFFELGVPAYEEIGWWGGSIRGLEGFCNGFLWKILWKLL